MAGSDAEGGSPRVSHSRDALEEEPRLKYNSLGAESPRAAVSAAAPATRLCVSDKVLAVGHRDGSVQLMDHLGNQVGWARTEAGRRSREAAGSPQTLAAAAAAACSDPRACICTSFSF